MSVKINIANQKFLNQFNNGIDFTANPLDFTTNLTGNVMGNVRHSFDINISWNFFAQNGNSLGITELTGTTIQFTKDNGNWDDEGFYINDDLLITWTDAGGDKSENGTITTLSDDIMIVTWPGLPIPGDLNGWITDSTRIYGLTPLTASVYSFGLNGRSESFNVESKVSENDQGYYGSNIGFDTGGGVRDTNFVTLQRLGQYKDWQTGSMKIRFVSSTLLLGQPIVQNFEVIHDFMITPYYLEGQLNNLQNNIIPNLLNGLNTLKYSFSPGFRTVLSNENTEKIKVVDSNNIGSVAWYGENFNGFQNDYNVKTIQYQDALTLDSADGLLIGSKTLVTATIERLSGVFAGAERFGVYASYLPEQNEYQDTLTTLKENFIYDVAFNNAGLAASVGDDFITECEASIVGGELVITFEVEYSTDQKTRLSQKLSEGVANFLIGIEVGDASLPSGNSDRVNLLADVNSYDESADISGLMIPTKFDIYQHDKQIGVDTPSTDAIVWNEDGIVVDFGFDLDLNKSAFLNSLNFVLIAFNTVTNEYFLLDSYSYNIGGAIVSGGIQQLNVSTNRGYILKEGDQFNDVTIVTGANAAGIQSYSGRFAQKFSWQDWIQNINADTIFYNPSFPNDNLNFKSSNYSDVNNYEIRISMLGNLDGINEFNVSGNTDYLINSPSIKVYDYTKDGLITPVWSGNIETYNASNLSNLSGAILTGQNTLIKVTWTNSLGAVLSLLNHYGINRIEETGDLGYQITEMSSINDPSSSQILIPSLGTLLNIYLDSGNVVMECLIDGSKVVEGQSYNLSSRINDGTISVEGKITEEGVDKETEQGILKIIE